MQPWVTCNFKQRKILIETDWSFAENTELDSVYMLLVRKVIQEMCSEMLNYNKV